jgi:hypothetical protein
MSLPETVKFPKNGGKKRKMKVKYGKKNGKIEEERIILINS